VRLPCSETVSIPAAGSMVERVSQDRSNGYEEIAHHFIAARNARIGPPVVREWSRTLSPGVTVLDLGCGHGVPTTQVLVEEGLKVYAIDASARLMAKLRERFPDIPSECAGVEESDFFGRTFDAVIAWGLLFLLTPGTQEAMIHKVAKVLKPGGKFVFTSLAQELTWQDSLTNRESVSLGAERYKEILRDAGLELTGEASDEGENHYYFASKPQA
jgi:2-polyprenyl-3-methyl-5-hydroxy-6-metoxy-1,4-benzoquinol methylase